MREATRSRVSKSHLRELPPVPEDRVLHDLIARKAYGLYEERGREDGHECEDWLEAERRVLAERKAAPVGRTSPLSQRAV